MSRIAYQLHMQDLEFSAIRAQGAGGQNVNKVSSAVMLRLDIHRATLPDALKQRLLHLPDQRINADGVIVIKAQEHRSQTQNRAAALQRLLAMLNAAALVPRRRVATQPTRGSKERRLQAKSLRSGLKSLRGSVND